MFLKRITTRAVVVAALVVLIIVGVCLGLYFGLRSGSSSEPTEVPPTVVPPSHETPPPSDSVLGSYWQAAVATNGVPCARIGEDILRRGGSAVEASIAALFCEGVACPQSMGVGGGFLMVIYNSANGTAEALNARETAPRSAYVDMFGGDSQLSTIGGLAAAVPGELLGYWRAFEKYRSYKVEWKDLIQPTVELCKKGVTVTPYLAGIMAGVEESIKKSETLSELLMPEGQLLREGELLKRPKLADTLQRIADSGNVDLFYDGPIGQDYVNDVNALGGNMTMDDLRNYEVEWEEAVVANLKDGSSVLTVPLPGSGPLLAFMLNILDEFIPAASTAATWQRITEAFKYGYGRRTELGDPHFEDMTDLVRNLTSRQYAEAIRADIRDDRTWSDPAHYGSKALVPEDHGTAHVSVLAPNGDAVSVTSTVNLIFGAKVVSLSTGIILNNEMDDFSAPNITNAFDVPPSEKNFIAPGKRPLSSMSPAIVVGGDGNVRLVTGAAGGTKITTATALTIMNCIWFNMTIKEAIDARRVHHQLYPMTLQVENGFYEDDTDALRRVGHAIERFGVGGSTVTGIAVNRSAEPYQTISANADFRRGGIVAGF